MKNTNSICWRHKNCHQFFASGGRNSFCFFDCLLDGKQFSLRLLRALFFFASLIPLILFLLYFKILSVFQTTKTTVHCRNGLSDLSIQKGLVQIFASFHIYVSKIFFACTDADIEFNFTFFGNLFQAVNKCWNIIQ